MDVSDEVHRSAQEVISAPAASLANALNTFIAKFVGWPFTAAPGFVVDDDGNRTDAFACVIHTTPARKDGRDAGGFPADGVATVIDAVENLDLEGLRRSCRAHRAGKAAEEEAGTQSGRRSANDNGNARHCAGATVGPAA